VALDPVDVVRHIGVRAPTAVILEHTTRRRLAAAVRAGRLQRVRRGVYALPELPDPAVTATRVGGVVSHASAAAWWRLSMVRLPDVVHVTVARGSRRTTLPGVRYHWSPSRQPPTPSPVTPVLQTVLDCAATMPFDEALAIADSALALHLVEQADLLSAAAAGPRTGRTRRLRVARASDARAANAFESRLRAVVLDAGLTGFEPQTVIRLSSGRQVTVDLADVARRIVLEADSYEHHGSREALIRDCERYDELVADGWTVLRFSWEHVMFRPQWVAEVVARTVRRQFGPEGARRRAKAGELATDGTPGRGGRAD
jgi:very-short-patch-repair endonuclease